MKSILNIRSFRLLVIAIIACTTQMVPVSGLAQAELVELTIEISGIEAQSGAVAIAVFDDPARYETRENPVARQTLPVSGDSLAWTVMLPAHKRYAVLAYHDVNANGELDIGRFGIPREPYGFSNDARSPLGPPRFAAAGFELTAEAAAIRLRVK